MYLFGKYITVNVEPEEWDVELDHLKPGYGSVAESVQYTREYLQQHQLTYALVFQRRSLDLGVRFQLWRVEPPERIMYK